MIFPSNKPPQTKKAAITKVAALSNATMLPFAAMLRRFGKSSSAYAPHSVSMCEDTTRILVGIRKSQPFRAAIRKSRVTPGFEIRDVAGSHQYEI